VDGPAYLAEALENTKFYHGVVSPRQSVLPMLQTGAFLCPAPTAVLQLTSIQRIRAPVFCRMRLVAGFTKNLFKTKAKGVKQ
jgi:hypothetical protein